MLLTQALTNRTLLKIGSVLVAAAIIAGCSTKKDFYATGGSRADGVVDMAYDFNRMETPVIDKKQAYSIARSKCSLWGYGDAEPFGGQIQICQARSGFGECSAWQVTVKYQCLGSLEQPQRSLNYLAPAAAPAAQPVRPSVTAYAPSAVASSPPPLSEQAYKNTQVQQLMQQNLSYEEYQARYKKIMGE